MKVKIRSVAVDTDLGGRTVKLAAPIEVDASNEIPPQFVRKLTEVLWGLVREVAQQAPQAPKAEA